MKDKILIILAIILVVAFCVALNDEKNQDRYEVVTSNNMLTILVDKKTGVTWRNCICGDKSNVPGCWERMYTINPDNYSKPIGEVTINKKLQKLILKQQKEAAKKPVSVQQTEEK